MNLFENKWKTKLTALLRGLEISNVDRILKECEVLDYEFIGGKIADGIKRLNGSKIF